MSLSVVMGLANLVPGLVRLFRGDKAGAIADQAVGVARQITGMDNEQDAVDAVRTDPALMVQFQQAMTPIVVAELEAQTAQLESVNQTMRAEYNQDDLYTKRWRPTYGYCTAFTWVIQMLSLSFIIGYAVITSPADAPAVISAITGMLAPLMVLWGAALSVLGISVSKRSDDKAVKLGQPPQAGLFTAIAKRIGGNNT